jgi:hypothetical protein
MRLSFTLIIPVVEILTVVPFVIEILRKDLSSRTTKDDQESYATNSFHVFYYLTLERIPLTTIHLGPPLI